MSHHSAFQFQAGLDDEVRESIEEASVFQIIVLLLCEMILVSVLVCLIHLRKVVHIRNLHVICSITSLIGSMILICTPIFWNPSSSDLLCRVFRPFLVILGAGLFVVPLIIKTWILVRISNVHKSNTHTHTYPNQNTDLDPSAPHLHPTQNGSGRSDSGSLDHLLAMHPRKQFHHTPTTALSSSLPMQVHSPFYASTANDSTLAPHPSSKNTVLHMHMQMHANPLGISPSTSPRSTLELYPNPKGSVLKSPLANSSSPPSPGYGSGSSSALFMRSDTVHVLPTYKPLTISNAPSTTTSASSNRLKVVKWTPKRVCGCLLLSIGLLTALILVQVFVRNSRASEHLVIWSSQWLQLNGSIPFWPISNTTFELDPQASQDIYAWSVEACTPTSVGWIIVWLCVFGCCLFVWFVLLFFVEREAHPVMKQIDMMKSAANVIVLLILQVALIEVWQQRSRAVISKWVVFGLKQHTVRFSDTVHLNQTLGMLVALTDQTEWSDSQLEFMLFYARFLFMCVCITYLQMTMYVPAIRNALKKKQQIAQSTLPLHLPPSGYTTQAKTHSPALGGKRNTLTLPLSYNIQHIRHRRQNSDVDRLEKEKDIPLHPVKQPVPPPPPPPSHSPVNYNLNLYTSSSSSPSSSSSLPVNGTSIPINKETICVVSTNPPPVPPPPPPLSSSSSFTPDNPQQTSHESPSSHPHRRLETVHSVSVQPTCTINTTPHGQAPTMNLNLCKLPSLRSVYPQDNPLHKTQTHASRSCSSSSSSSSPSSSLSSSPRSSPTSFSSAGSSCSDSESDSPKQQKNTQKQARSKPTRKKNKKKEKEKEKSKKSIATPAATTEGQLQSTNVSYVHSISYPLSRRSRRSNPSSFSSHQVDHQPLMLSDQREENKEEGQDEKAHSLQPEEHCMYIQPETTDQSIKQEGEIESKSLLQMKLHDSYRSPSRSTSKSLLDLEERKRRRRVISLSTNKQPSSSSS